MAQEDKDFWDSWLAWVLRIMATVLAAILGMYGFALVGSLSYPGVGVVVGGVMGLVFFGCLGCCLTGLWRSLIPTRTIEKAVDMMPGTLTSALGNHGPFTLVVTVHEITGKSGIATSLGNILGAGSHTFVEVECGLNPMKQTCARPDLQYGEQFKLKVKATDGGINFTIKDQDVFGATKAGQVNLNIKRNIIDEGFPSKPVEDSFPITNRAGSLKDYPSAKLRLTFDAMTEYDENHHETINTPLLKHEKTLVHEITKRQFEPNV